MACVRSGKATSRWVCESWRHGRTRAGGECGAIPKITRKELAHNRKTTKRCIGLGIFKNLVDDSDHNATQTSNLGRIDV